MEREFCSYEQSLALKELGFDEDCFVSFFIPNLYSIKFTATTKRNSTLAMGKDGCTAPLKQQVFRWLSIQLDMPDLMIPVDDLAQNMLIDKLILELKSKHLLL